MGPHFHVVVTIMSMSCVVQSWGWFCEILGCVGNANESDVQVGNFVNLWHQHFADSGISKNSRRRRRVASISQGSKVSVHCTCKLSKQSTGRDLTKFEFEFDVW